MESITEPGLLARKRKPLDIPPEYWREDDKQRPGSSPEPKEGRIPPILDLFVGNFDEYFVDLCSSVVKKVVSGKYRVRVHSNHMGEVIMEYAENVGIDLYMILVNNINYQGYPDGICPLKTRLVKTGHLIKELKIRFGTPIIAFLVESYQEKYHDLVSNVIAYSDFYLPNPCKLKTIEDAIRSCLRLS